MHYIKKTQRHDFESIKKHTQQKYIELQNFETRANEHIIPDIKHKENSADKDFDEVVEIIQSRIQNSKDQGVYLRELIDDQVSNTEAEYNDLLTRYRGNHAHYKTKTRDAVETVHKLIAESTKATKSNNNHLLINVAKDVASMNFSISNYEKPDVPSFMHGSDPEKHIIAAFGYMDKDKRYPMCTGTNIQGG